ncbi:putative ABC transport system ATP-binding protein [Butyrivibrio hungatei]|uniref:Putative ABC transport system ATP-binding protein n=1 Tax=Butyrivibrio hungatei TaxID=185008 RepID=A0A1G5ESX4_9FIRM|nr:ATP-binding cassette domain-containing protein [Butyrivibrio hungatei]SCY30082.1 putative ABC transport system ATP-binding protein [Butyrivibrio hungatei]
MDIRLDAIIKKYKRDKREFTVLDNISVTLPQGKFTVISGDSGVGKSTLLNIVAGLSKPTEGKVYYGEKEITALGDEELAKLRTGFMGVMTQNCELIPYLTLIENLKLAYDISAKGGKNKNLIGDGTGDSDDTSDNIGNGENISNGNNTGKGNKTGKESPEGEEPTSFSAELLDALGLSQLRNEYPSSLSSGEIKRAAIARTLITKPDLIIMDEPTANLDRKNVRAVLQLLKRFSTQGSTVIISSHEQEAIAEADFKYELEHTT